MNDTLFQDAKDAADIEEVAGVPLYRCGKLRRGACPLPSCGAGVKARGKAKANGPFVVDPHEKWFKCWVCGGKGDVIKLEHLVNGRPGETEADAARRLLGIDRGERPAARPPAPEKAFVPDDQARGWTTAFADRIWKESAAAPRTLVERYLRSRAITGLPLDVALKRLRFHPAVWHGGIRDAFPAMIGRVHAPAGATGGIHVTYLRADGRGKIDVEGTSAKIMYGPQERDGSFGGVWLSHPLDPGPLIVAEGIETAISLACLMDKPCRMVAALALDRLQGGWRADKNGCKDIALPRPDPRSPAFTWPEAPAAPWGEVLIAVDHDMKPLRIRTRGAMGAIVDIRAGPAERASVCAALAAAAWSAVTDAKVTAMMPSEGKDFNDMLKDRAACMT